MRFFGAKIIYFFFFTWLIPHSFPGILFFFHYFPVSSLILLGFDLAPDYIANIFVLNIIMPLINTTTNKLMLLCYFFLSGAI